MDNDSAHLGLLRIEEYSFALSSDTLQQVIPRPVTAILPDAGPFATGVFSSGGVTVPVFDVAPLLTGVSAAPKSRPLIAILRHQDAILSLEIDGFRKVVRYEAGACTDSLEQNGGTQEAALLFPQSFWDGELGGAVGIMNAAALFHAPGIRAARAHSVQTASGARVAATVNLALFEVNGRTFGVDIRYVREALHPGKITLADFGGAVLYGHHPTEDRQTPIFRLPELLQISSQGGSPDPRRGLVIGSADSEDQAVDLTVGFLIEDVVGTVTVPVSDIHPLDRSGMRRTHFYAGILATGEAGHILVLDPEALLREVGVRRAVNKNSLSAEITSASSQNARQQELAAVQTFVVYRAGSGSLASPLNSVEAIVPLGDVFPLGQPGEAFVGVMPWRGRSVNLLNVAALMSRTQTGAEPCRDVLIALDKDGQAETYYGFLVNQVESLTSAALEAAPLLNRPEMQALPKECNADFFGRMIRVSTGQTRRNFSVLDLTKLTRFIAEGQLSQALADRPTPASLN